MAEQKMNPKDPHRPTRLRFEHDAFSGKWAFAGLCGLLMFWAIVLSIGAFVYHDHPWQRILVIAGTVGVFVLLWAAVVSLRR